jgi:hypothetical protein
MQLIADNVHVWPFFQNRKQEEMRSFRSGLENFEFQQGGGIVVRE